METALVIVAVAVLVITLAPMLFGEKNDSADIVLAPDTIYYMITSQQLAQAIAQAEGYGQPGAIPTRANNPGDLALGDRGNGVVTSAGGEQLTVFATAQDGWNALLHQCDLMLTGRSHVYSLDMTLADVGDKYANGDPNWSVNVANSLASQTGLNVTTETTLQQLASV